MSQNSDTLYRFDEFEFDPSRRVLTRGSTPLALSPKAFEVLRYLLLNPGRVITKEELLHAVWPDSFVEESNLAQHISWLRKALTDKSGCIATIPGRGYQFTAKVQTVHSVETLPESLPGDIFVQRVRERTHVVIEKLPPAPPSLALAANASPRRSLAVWWIAGAALAGALLALAGNQIWRRTAKPPLLCKVMVAEFGNTTGDAAFDRTLKRALEIGIEQSPYMDVMSEREAVDALHLMGKDGNLPIAPEIARELCERSNRQVLLTGNIASVGREYLVTLEATDCGTGKKLASSKAEAASREKVLTALDYVADRVRSGLGESSRTLESYRMPIMTATTASLEALKSYSIGQYMAAQGKGENETLPLYQRAIALDPQFAMAYGAMATDYYNLSEMNLAAQYYKKAFELSDRVSARERLILQAHYYADGLNDAQRGIEAYRQWAETYPNDWAPWVDMANEYTQLGQYAPAISAARRALEIQPDRAINYSVLVRAYKRANRFADAKAAGLEAVQRKKDSVGLHASLYEIAVAEHDADARSRETVWAAAHSGGWYGADFLYLQAEESATSGKYREAEEFFRRAYEIAGRENLPETADNLLLEQARAEAAFGYSATARATLGHMHNLDADSPDFAILQAELGDASFARRFLAAHGADTHPGTLMAFVSLPRVRAALAAQSGKPLDAVNALEPATRFELADFSVLAQRAEALLRAKRPDLAIHEYLKIVANRGVDPVSILYPLAHLGLARAFAMEGNSARSRNEYEKFFDSWKDADADTPVLRQAQVEYSRVK